MMIGDRCGSVPRRCVPAPRRAFPPWPARWLYSTRDTVWDVPWRGWRIGQVRRTTCTGDYAEVSRFIGDT